MTNFMLGFPAFLAMHHEHPVLTIAHHTALLDQILELDDIGGCPLAVPNVGMASW